MKTASKNLEDDHVFILKLTDVMEKIPSIRNPEIAHLEQITDIIRQFADGIHHAKEEEHYFPFLGTKGFASSAGPVAVMLNDHAAGRNYVKGMVEGIILYKNGNSEALEGVFKNMTGYAALLKSHIAKENNILFRMGDQVTSDIENEELLKKFAEAEEKHANRDIYIKQITYLSDFYGI